MVLKDAYIFSTSPVSPSYRSSLSYWLCRRSTLDILYQLDFNLTNGIDMAKSKARSIQASLLDLLKHLIYLHRR